MIDVAQTSMAAGAACAIAQPTDMDVPQSFSTYAHDILSGKSQNNLRESDLCSGTVD